MKKFDFYFKYAWRSVLRGGQRSFFAVLCVAVGVAALVALQSLSVSIRDTLVGDIQTRAGGDVIARAGFTSEESRGLSPEAGQFLDKLKSEGRIQEWTTLSSSAMQIRGYFSFPPTLYSVDPTRFPLYGKVEMVEPAGGDFQKLLAQPNSIVLSKYLAEKNEYKLGQEIEVTSGTGLDSSGRVAKLKVVGIVKTDVPGLTFDAGLIFGFGMVSQQTAATFIDGASATGGQRPSVFIKTAPTGDNETLALDLRRASVNGVGNRFVSSLFSDIETARDRQQEISENLTLVEDMLSYVGLLAILIGGIGVVNTMLVVIGRRTTEIATVKALGLKNRQTVTIFTLEALILGVMGSVLGVLLGVGLGFIVKGVAEGLFFRPLNWGFYPGPILVGLIVGILTSGVFGFLPSYAAGRVRPAVVLRQQTSALPRIGGIATVIIILLMTLALGLIGGVLINNIVLGIIVGFITLFTCLFLTAFMYLAVFLFGKLPAPFGPSFKMALRSFSRHRGRTATTLLVMTVGLFFITFIVIIADSIKTSFQQTFEFNLGFNVVAFNLQGGRTEQIQSSLQQEVPGIQQVFAGNSITSEILTVNGSPAQPNTPAQPVPGPNAGARQGSSTIQLSGRSLANGQSVSPNGPQRVLSGRNFTPADMDKRVLIVSQDEAQRFNLSVGSKVGMRLSPTTFGPGNRTTPTQRSQAEFEVIGIVEKASSATQFERGWVTPFQVVSEAGTQFSIFYMLVDRAQIKPALTKAQGLLIGGFVFDLGDLVDTFTRILDQVLAFPLLLSLLSLFSGAILIANNVALAVLERRTEIGVLKAIGAKRRRVLNILLWESSLVGFLGGFIGVGTGIGLALLVPLLLSATSRNPNAVPITWSPLTAALLLALGIGLAIFATLISAWKAIQEKPLVVLRYE